MSGFHCPEVKNEDNPVCKGHLTRDFVKECCTKCGCSKNCGNRVVQRGITRKLEVLFRNHPLPSGMLLSFVKEGQFNALYLMGIM